MSLLFKIREKGESRQVEIQDEVAAWDPHNDPNANSDAFKTLFVSRIVSDLFYMGGKSS